MQVAKRSLIQVSCNTGGDNNASAQVTVKAALGAGFKHIDTAYDYGDQGGVGQAVRDHQQHGGEPTFLTTKVPG